MERQQQRVEEQVGEMGLNEMNQEEDRVLERSQSRRQQFYEYSLGQHNNNMVRPVPEQVEPFLIELEQPDNNPNNMTVYENHPFTSQYRIINPNNLQVTLQQSHCNNLPQALQTKKEISYEKIIIYGIVWLKDVNGLFDYEQKSKVQKSSIVIQDDVKSYINFIQHVEETLLPKSNDVYLLIFKNIADKTIHYEKKTLQQIKMTALKRQQKLTLYVNNPSQRKSQFLCALKLIKNTSSNQFTIKVFSYNELNDQVKIFKRPKILDGISNLSLTQSDIQETHDPKTQPYFIVRTLNKSQPMGKKIHPGDLIKLGKVELKVISIDGHSIQDNNCQQDRKALQVTQIDEETQKGIECKYCLSGKSEEQDNFFLHLCNCKGHIGYVHYNCLTTWTKTKSTLQSSENVKIHYLQKMKCQVCLEDFPKYFKYNGKVFHLLPLELPEKHMLLVDISQKQNSIIAVISGNTQKSLMIGRGRNAALRINDITVSRDHATIQRQGDEYYLKDSKSKFGTLVRSTEKEIEERIDHKKGFQIGNVIFTIQVVTKQVEIEKQKQQLRQLIQQNQDIQNENHENQQKVEKINNQSQQNQNIIKNESKYYHHYQQQQNQNNNEEEDEDEQNYQGNGNENNQEFEENTRSTKRSIIRKQFIKKKTKNQNDERQTQSSAFRRKNVPRSRSRNNYHEASQSNSRPIERNERRRQPEIRRRDLSK